MPKQGLLAGEVSLVPDKGCLDVMADCCKLDGEGLQLKALVGGEDAPI